MMRAFELGVARQMRRQRAATQHIIAQFTTRVLFARDPARTAALTRQRMLVNALKRVVR